MSNPVERLLGRLEKVRPNGPHRWMACCPAHKDGSPSLSIKEAEGGRILIHCFAGCEAGDVVAAVGLTLADLFPKQPGRPGNHWRRERLRAALRHELDVLIVALADLDAGRAPSPEDAQRAFAARRRIDKLRERLNEPQRL
ncbi:virulence-associated protein E [Alcanivorax sp. IO_7]|nr:virulence-associated protein E [Alcanivorax sp. IO_7]